MKRAIVVAVMVLAACSPEADPIPEVTESYRLDRDVPVCWATYAEVDGTDEEPARYGCVWQPALFEGVEYASVALAWERRDGQWVEVHRYLRP